MAKSKDQDTDEVVQLRAQLEAERSARASAEGSVQTERQARRAAEKANMSAQERSVVTALESSEAQIEALDGQIESYENEIARLADEPGHGKEIAALNRKMAEAVSGRGREADKKAYLASEREKMKTQAERQPAEEAAGEKMPNGAPLASFDPKTQEFIRQNPRLMTDAAFFRKGIAAAQSALELEGLRDQSTEYFDYIAQKLGLKATPQQEDGEQDEQDDEGEDVPPIVTERRPAASRAAAAPVTRQAPATGSSGGNRRTTRLTAEQTEVALELYGGNMSRADAIKKYADNLAYMQSKPNGYFKGFN